MKQIMTSSLTEEFFNGNFDFIVVDPRQTHFDLFCQIFPVFAIFQRALVQRRDPRERVAQNLQNNNIVA